MLLVPAFCLSWKRIATVVALLQVAKVVFGQAGSFPPTENVGLHKPISTNGEKTCGSSPDQTSYCEPVTDNHGLANQACDRKACNLECPGRDRDVDGEVPNVNVMDGNLRNCITPDYQDNRGTRQPAFRFLNHPTCFAQPREALETGTSPGQFTLAVWIKQMHRNAGVIVEKVASPRPGYPRQVVFSIMVGAYSILLQYLGSDGQPHMQILQVPFPAGEWHHLTLQVYGTIASVFLDGVGSDGTPVLTEQLDYGLVDLSFSPYVKIGQRMQEGNNTAEMDAVIKEQYGDDANSTGQFIGLLMDYRWYKIALTNREIQEIYSGTFEELNVQSNCLCPRGYARVHPLQERYCIPNGVPDTTEYRRLRLHENAHPLAYINDGDYSTSWISTNFYMRGGVTMTFDMENGEYQIFNIAIRFWNPQPQAITISRLSNRTTEGTHKTWGYFADECMPKFGMEDNQPLKEPDSFNCITFPDKEKIPYMNNNITFNLLSEEPFPRPGKDDFYNNPVLMDFVTAEQIGFRMQYQYFTARADVDVGHQIYAIKEIEIRGRCNCHGHADACDMESIPYQCKCIPRSNTGGYMCEQCLPLYNNKPFRMGTNTEAFDCQPCECHGHADSCHYDEGLDSFPNNFYEGGGGRCDNCKHHTTGINCEMCAEFFFRMEEVALDDSNVCLPCDCHPSGVVNGTADCEKINGQCDCKEKVDGRTCGICIDGYYNLLVENLEGCEVCDCHLPGTVGRDFKCEQEGGQCKCKVNIQSRTCSECKPGFKDLRDSNVDGCEACDCHIYAAEHQHCNSTTGNCKCKENVEGMYCDMCMNGFWKLPDSVQSLGCEPCTCDESGTVPGTVCDKETGQCVCKANTEGRTCNVCKDIFFNLDIDNEQGCENCHCDPRGTVDGSLICDKESGQCSCKPNVEGRLCNECKGNTFGLDWDLEEGCQPCNCDPSGTQQGNLMAANELVCHATSGQCACMSHRQGRRCDECEPEYYLPPDGESGCFVCDCHPYASSSEICNNATGQCPCKEDAGIMGRTCDECADTFWKFNHLFGSCEECNCNQKGSLNDSCNAITGVCSCKGNVIGDKCDECREGSSVLTADNPMGCYSHPEQQAPPFELQITSSAIDLAWNPPDLPNGDGLQYELFRNSELIYEINDTAPFSTMYYNDTDLLPYTDYDYYIETSNVGGTATSTEARHKTLAGIPTGVPPLEVSDVTSYSATFEWGEPEVAHGPIDKYVLQSVDAEFDRHPKEHYSGLDLKADIYGLRAFVNYTFTLRACTTGGCGDSLPIVVITPEAKPEKQNPPTITAISNTSLLIEWERPEEPNGILLSYKVLWRGKPDENGVHHPMQAVAFEDYGQDDPRPKQGDGYSPLEPLERNFTIDGLQPYTEYQFLVSSANSVGSTESTWETGRTLEGDPLFIGKPRAWAVSSSQINITWIAPDLVTEVRGAVKMYQVVWVKENTDTEYNLPPFENKVLYSTGPKNLNFLARNLEPFVNYTFFINLCNSVSCVESERVTVRTLPAAPESQAPPVQDGEDTHSISTSWDLPEKVNGPDPRFTLFKSPVAFSSPPIEMNKGIRFPGDSYLRYSPDILPKDASYSGIQLKFRTYQENAIVFFAASKLASDYTRHEYLVIQLRDGRPWFLFDLQNSPTSVTVDNDDINARYNDGKWHRIEINRFEKDGFIELDGSYTGSGIAKGTATVYGTSDEIYIGGLPRGYNVARPHDRGTMVVIEENFVGCIKDISVQRTGRLKDWSNVTFDQAEEVHRTYDAWQGCPDVLDAPAAHFLGRGYLKMKNVFDVSNSNTWSIRMQIRPAFSSGILFYAAGRKKNFIMGTINNGTLRFIVSMGDEDYHDLILDPATLTIPSSLCDSNWHLTEFRNSNGRLSLLLDDHLEIGPLLHESYNGIDLSQKFYLGGIEDNLKSESSHLMEYFEDDGRSFGGCIRGFHINLIETNLISECDIAYNVDLDGCPTGAENSHILVGSGGSSGDWSGLNSGGSSPLDALVRGTTAPKQTCQDDALKVIHEGYNFEHNSTELNSFTQYLYRIMASNDGGDTRSNWKIMRAGEGIPEKVGSPYDARHISGYVVEVMWRRPYHSKGVIMNYTLTAVPLDDNLPASNYTVNTTFDGELYVGNITDLHPWSGYDVYLSACTKIGCTRSTGNYNFITKQEAPYFVQEPTGDVTRNTMTLSWIEPSEPNGIIVNYTLYHNNSKVYTGKNMRHTIDGLATFQQQRFKVEACTVAGCNMSEEVTIHSSQLPPGHVDPPMLKVLGPTSLAIEWLQPAVLNGIFKRYVIHMSNEEGALGKVVYNSTDPFVEHEMHDLLSGMDYYVTLEACTGGGCKKSSQTFKRTTESIPEDIPKPEVISRSPYSFDVTWHEPLKPNGVITNYSIYMNDVLRYTTPEPSTRHIEMLTPYSRHTFRLEVCTVKGCAFSPLAVNRTQESKPEGDVTVSVTVVDSRSLDAKWNMPMKQNGIMNYTVLCTGLFFVDLVKRDFREVYESRILHVGDRAEEWVRIEGLLPYTDYMIQVNASNSKGYIMSNMRTVSMPPGAPDGVNPPDLVSTSPYEIVATWEDPVRNNAPGNAFFQLQYRRVTPMENEKDAFKSRTRQMSFSLKNLQPNEEYEFRLTAFNSFGSTDSDWVSIHAQQTAPGYLAPPHVFDLDSWSLSLRWRPPSVPNGIIQNYTIYEKDEIVVSLPANHTHHLIEDLEPFTRHNFVLEACNEGGCTRSDATSVQTSAAAPEGLAPPEARSESPTSVFVTWKPPEIHNGILDNYILDRRPYASNESSESDSDEIMLGSFVPSQSLRYLDDSSLLQPFSTYQYRVTSSTIGGGSTTSNWTTITTRAGRPGGLTQPVVTVLSPRSALVEWSAPVTTNGPIVRYEVLFPDPQFTLDGNNTFNLTVTELIPFTEYQVSVIACTDGGCSESLKTDITTLTTVPEGLDPPAAVPVSESYVSVQWKPPEYPNGPGIFYELTRTKLDQPLVQPTPDDISVPLTIYKGTELFFEDRELQKYTKVSYSLSCFNVDGSVTSNITTVTTLGGVPQSSPVPRVAVLNHTSTRITWDAPSVFEIQGAVEAYIVRYEADGYVDEILSIAPNERSTVIGNLQPGMNYSIVLTVDNGAHNISSYPVFVRTKDGAPEGVFPPVVYSLSASELHASWLAPENPNGDIIEYSIYLDNMKITMNTNRPSSYVLSDLQPFTVYNLQLEACTMYACARSDITQATTQETVPDHFERPIIKILGANKIEVNWIAPKQPNGILKSYEVHRRSLLPCAQLEPDEETKVCTYVRCRKNERPCGNSCYSPSLKVCCDGNLFFQTKGYECCGKQYIRSKSNASDVCCVGKFHSAMKNYECCGKRYVQVLDGEICCEDANEDRVSVGAGDLCCGVVPYYSDGVQICCGGQLHDGFKKKCCGGQLIDADKVCCGGETAKVYTNLIDHECCGNEYVSTHDSLCCQDSITGKEAVHRFDGLGDGGSRMKCCSTQLISSDMKCCNGRGYSSQSHVCADVGTIASPSELLRCGSGAVCSVNQAPSAFCDRCDFDLNVYDCFVSQDAGNENDSPGDGAAMCATSFVTVYSGPPNELSFTDETVDAYTRYEYKVLASNKMGSAESEIVAITTFQSIPDGVDSPDWTSNNQDTIMLSWKEPKKPNGVITRYVMTRDGLEIWRGEAFHHTDSFQILPFRRYSYILKACTYVGCGSSPPVQATSIQGVPGDVQPPLLTVQSPYNITIAWTAPSEANGLIINYVLNETDVGTIYKIDPVEEDSFLSYDHETLEPHSTHTYTLTACTIAGCSTSEEVSATTSEAQPEGVWVHPAALSIDMSTVEIFWTSPRRPNGVIREYRLLRRKMPTDTGNSEENLEQLQLIYQGGPEQLNYTDTVPEPELAYEYVLLAINGAGFGRSEPHLVKMPRNVPQQIPTLDVRVTGAETLFAQWSLDENDFPATYRYSVIIRPADASENFEPNTRSRRSIEEDGPDGDEVSPDEPLLIYSVGHNQTYVIEKLSPYTLYRVRVRTCLPEDTEEIDCVTGEEKLVRTLSAAPQQQPQPELKAVGPRVVDVTWSPPRRPNGVISQYQIYRRKAVPQNSPIKLIFSTGDMERNWFTDSDPELTPFTRYEYRVRVRNSEGFTESSWAHVTTLQDTPQGITSPSVIPISAYAVRVLWSEPEMPNGNIIKYSLEYRHQSSDPAASRHIVDVITVPSTLREAHISGLKPFTSYEVRLMVVNGAGMEARSDWVSVKTSAAPPSGVGNLSVVKMEDGRSLLLTWDPPAVPNGEITTYNIYEYGFETPLQSGLFRQFHLRRLKPYTNYTLLLEACTGHDLCATSAPQTFTTSETVPDRQSPPTISLANTTAVTLFWTKPKEDNGVILSYKVIRNEIPRSYSRPSHPRQRRSTSTSRIVHYMIDYNQWVDEDLAFTSYDTHTRVRRAVDEAVFDSDGSLIIYQIDDPPEDGTFNYTDTNLKPFTKYEYKIRTSTRAGHTDSDWVTAETHQASPSGLAAPEIIYTTDRNPTELIVRWTLPEQLNGILQTFRVQRNASNPLSFPTNQFQFTDTGLKPYSLYSYSVTACTSGGCSESPVSVKRTLEEAPLFVSAPVVVSVDSTTLHVEWTRPTITNGVIRRYQVLIDDQMRYEGLAMQATIGELSPYTLYTVKVAACTSSGCRTSDGKLARTDEAPPQVMSAPELHVTSPHSIEVNWEPPIKSNGKIVRYELRRNGELIFVADGNLRRYHDFSLKPGTTYTYFVTAFNKRGSVQSGEAAEMTDPAAPAGLEPPKLTASSSSSIHASWDAPASPNGIIVNFTLHVRRVKDKNDEKILKLPGNVYEYIVRGLFFFEDYSFWLQSCTKLGCVMSERTQQKTLEGIPSDQKPPFASLSNPDDIILHIAWDAPDRPNGIISMYELHRRRIIETQSSIETVKGTMVYNGTSRSYTDMDLLPYTKYQYKITALNSAGEVTSDWSSLTRTGEAAPERMAAPSFGRITERSVQVIASEPLVPNGDIRSYTVYARRNVSSDQFRELTTGFGRDQTAVGLIPFTSYEFRVKACTLEQLCVTSPSAYTTTMPAPPRGQNAPLVVSVSSRNVTLQWSAPAESNGIINSYEIHMRKSCPPPYQPLKVECYPGSATISYVGISQQTTIRNLSPYESYGFRVVSVNDYGRSESDWTTTTTSSSAPKYVAPMSVTSNISSIYVVWTSSFQLNSIIVQYELSDRGKNVYTGFNTAHRIKRTAAMVHEFQVKVTTDTGVASSPVVMHDTGKGSSYLPGPLEPDERRDPDVATASVPVYETIWFIAVIVLISIMVVFTVLGVVLRRMSSRYDDPLKGAPVPDVLQFSNESSNGNSVHKLQRNVSHRSVPTTIDQTIMQDPRFIDARQFQNEAFEPEWPAREDSRVPPQDLIMKREKTPFVDTHL